MGEWISSELDDIARVFGSSADDAVIDTTLSAGSIFLAGKAGAGISIAGSFVPGAGNVVGAVTGFVAGVGLYFATDVLEVGGKSFRNHVKDGFNSIFGWE